MGWSGGTMVMYDIMHTVQEYVDNPDVRTDLYVGIIEALQGADWDTACECKGEDPAFDRALETVNRKWCEKRGYNYEEWFGEDS